MRTEARADVASANGEDLDPKKKESAVDRRVFLKTGIGVSASAVLARLPAPTRALAAAGTSDRAAWRVFEVTTRVEIANAAGAGRAWVPLPLMPDTDYHKNLGSAGPATPRAPAPSWTRSTAPACSTRSGRRGTPRRRSRS